MPTGVLHLKEVDTDEITLDGTLSVSGLSALKGDTVLHKTLSVGETTTLAADTNATNVNLSGTLSVSGQTTIGGDILPDTNDAYDIGSPEFKIRDLYVSNNSIWVGDDMKISNVNGSLKFRKRKTNEVPKAILDAGANAGHANEQATADAALAHAGVTNVADMKLQHWFKFMRTLNAAAKLTDIFRDNDDDYEETSASDAWKEIADTNKIYANSMVGVGTSDPDDTLHVKGSFKVESETGFKLIRSSVGGTDPTVIIDTQNFGVDDTVNDLTGRGDSKYTKLYRVFGRNSEGVGRSWYWGYANDDYANISLAFDGGGIPDPDIAFTFTTASELYCNKVYAALGGNADTATLAASATKLETPRKINGVDFDGTQDITLSTEATKLATPVNINGVAFDGSSDININEISGASEVPIKKIASDAATDTYSYILNAPRPGTTSGGAVHFINGAGRSVDGGASTYTIRNDSGTLQLGRSDQTTKIMGNVEFEINPFSGSGSVAGITSSDGKIGMFTSSPAYPLDLSSSSYTAMRYRRSVSGGGVGFMLENGDGDSWHVACGGNTGRFGINRAGDAFGSQLAIMQTGEFGIGTASPGKHLDVHFTGDSGIRAKNTGSGHASMYIDSYTGYSYVRFQDKGADKFYLQSTPSGDLAFRPNGGSHAMDIKSNGNVGIGTTNPQAKLHIESAGDTGLDIYGGDPNHPYIFVGEHYSNYANKWGMKMKYHGNSNTAWFTMNVIDNNVETNALTIHRNASVAIGGTNPLRKFHVFSGVGNSTTDWISGVFGGTGDYPRTVLGSINSVACIGSHNSALTAWSDLYINDPGNNFVVKTNGYVGIGTNSPSGKFHVHNGRMLLTDNLGDFTGIHTSTGVTSRAQFVLNSHYSDLVIASSKLNNNGHGSTLSFTNTNPDNAGDYRKFVIGFGNYTTNESRHRLYFGYQNAAQVNPHAVYGHGHFQSHNVMTLDGISKNVYVVGTMHVNGFINNSDDRMKTNERYITNATATLNKLKPQTYTKTIGAYKSTEITEGTAGRSKTESGLIAQDIYYDAPELRHLVSCDDNAEIPDEKPFVDNDPTNDPDYSMWGEYAGVDYIGLIAYLVQAVKENEEDKANLKLELESVKSSMDNLLSRVQALEYERD